MPRLNEPAGGASQRRRGRFGARPLLELLAGPAEEDLSESLPVRREPLWLTISSRSERHQAGAERVETREHFQVGTYE